MEILVSKHSGFCFGVKRAVDTAYSLTGENNYILGEIIHNESVINNLKQKGLITLKNLDEVDLKKGSNLLIRTHGEPESTFIKASELDLNIIDCTCPFVKDIQKIVKSHYDRGYTIVIIGRAEHPEVIGINGWCNKKAIITEDSTVLSSIETEKICIVVQTTYSEEKFDKIIKNFDSSKVKTVDIFKTICYTTK